MAEELKLDPHISRRQVSKPTSMMRSSTMSVQSETVMLSVLAVVLGTTQVFVMGDQALRSSVIPWMRHKTLVHHVLIAMA